MTLTLLQIYLYSTDFTFLFLHFFYVTVIYFLIDYFFFSSLLIISQRKDFGIYFMLMGN